MGSARKRKFREDRKEASSSENTDFSKTLRSKKSRSKGKVARPKVSSYESSDAASVMRLNISRTKTKSKSQGKSKQRRDSEGLSVQRTRMNSSFHESSSNE